MRRFSLPARPARLFSAARGFLLGVLLLSLGCDGETGTQPAAWTIHVSDSAPFGVRETADDLARYLEAMGREVERSSMAPPATCVGGVGHVVFTGDGLGEPITSDSDQTWSIAETRCGAGSRVELSGGGLLGRQYAGYEWLHRLGVRFFHPEQEFIPEEPQWPAEPVEVVHTPAFRWRSVSLHLTHPLELGDAFRLGDETYYPEAVRYIDWQIKNGASRGHGGIGTGEHATRGLDRGFLLSSGMSLHNQQQGGRPIVDPDDPRTDEEQIQDAIDERFNREDGRVPQVFGFSFNPSEFTEIHDEDAVRQMTFITDYISENWPDTLLEVTNHGTWGPPTETYGVRYYDLPQFAPPELGVKVHTLMFYDLFRPAPVYGNTSFEHMYDFMVDNYLVRHITHFPESAWWLTFDNAVPLYLPITVEARDRDIQGIAWMLDGMLDGHHVFGSGHEWGYWQNEYCSFRMAADTTYRWQDCFSDITGIMGEAGPEVQSVLEDLVALQEQDLVLDDRQIIRYLVGTDSETEVAASIGIEFHPLPPPTGQIMRWNADQVAEWLANEMVTLRRIDTERSALVERLTMVEASVPEAARPWFDEIRDGVEINAVRARHAWQVYGALVTLRSSQLTGNAELRTEADDLLRQARSTTERALEVTHRREDGYRYLPLSRSVAGGPDGTEDENWTIYGYRYMNRAHHAFYYVRIDEMAQAAFEGGADPVTVSDALLSPTEALGIQVVEPSLTDVVVEWGDGSATESGETMYTHDYAAPDVYPLAISGVLGGDDVAVAGDVAELLTEYQTGFTGTVQEPAGVDIIEGVLPGLVFGRIDATRVAVGFTALAEGTVRLGSWTLVAAADSVDATLLTVAADLEVPVVNRSSGAETARLIIHDAVVRLDPDGSVSIVGDLDIAAVINAVVAIGGFDAPGARRVVASTLGYTPETLPEQVSFSASYTTE